MGADELTPQETDRGLRPVFRQGIAGHAMGTIAGGIVIVKVAVLFEAPLFAIGLLAALPALGQLAQLPAIYRIERVRNRKRITFIGLGVVRLCILGIGVVALVISPLIGLVLLLALISLQGAFAAVGPSAWNSMVRDLAPEHRLGTFFGRRQQVSLLVGFPSRLVRPSSSWAGGRRRIRDWN